jgi:hypothetical protein
MGIGLGIGINRSNYAQGIFNAYQSRVTADGGITEGGACVDAVSGLLLTASLLLIPSGYKSGKAYAEIPTNGNGDLTWTRASDAWRTNADGLIQRVPWNLLQQSEDFTNGTFWFRGSGTSVTANTTTAPNGTITADTIIGATGSYSFGGANTFYSAFGGLYSSQTYTFSVYLKGSGTVQLNFRDGSTGATNFVVLSLSSSWQRFDISRATASASTSLGIVLSGASGNFDIWGAQLVEGSSAQTYFPTTDRLNVPRLSYMYGSCPALLLEPQRTNSIRNSTMVGASTSPSTTPTNWQSFSSHGLTVSVVGLGTETGINYIDLNYNGTANSSDVIRLGFEQATQISASNGQSWSLSTYAKIISQSAPPSSYDLRITERTAIGVFVTSSQQSFTPTSTLKRFTFTSTLNGGVTVGAVIPEFQIPVTNGISYNFTIRIAQPQMELGAYATTPIFTTGSASATRVADSFSRNNIYTNGLITSSGGTWFVELRNNVAYVRDTSGNTLFVGDNSTGSNNALTIRNDSPSTAIRFNIVKYIGGVQTGLFSPTTSTVKIAIKWNGSTADIFVNGTKQISATAFTPTNMEFLGCLSQVPTFVQAMALYPTPLSDTDCTTITTL